MASIYPLPIVFDSAKKTVSLEPENGLTSEQQTAANKQIDLVNKLNRHLVSLNADVPRPPNEIDQQITTQINKLRDAGIHASKNAKFPDAIKYFTQAIDLSTKRLPWEASSYVLGETGHLLSLRCDVLMISNLWAQAYTDASMLSVIQAADPKNFYRKGKCLERIGKLVDVKQCYLSGLAIAPNNSELNGALAEINALL